MDQSVIIITREGKQISLSDWQKSYGLEQSKTRIGQFFYLTEPRFKKDLELFNLLVVNELLIRFLDALRKASGHPLTINSFNRSTEKQQELKAAGFRTAETSPHVVVIEGDKITGGCATDIDTLSDEDTNKLVKIIKQVSEITGIKVRIGYKQYQQAKQTFVHIDVCPEFYASGKPWNAHPHPAVWEKQIEW